MKTLKKSISLFLLLLLVLSTAACGDKAAAEDSSSQNKADASDAADDPSRNTPVTPDADDNSSLNSPNIPGIGDNSPLYTPNGAGTGNYDQNGTNIPGTGSNYSSGTYTLEDLFNGNLDDLYFDAFSTVTEFYNSDVRVMLEDMLNQVFQELNDLAEADVFPSISISVEEPDIVIYNYHCPEALDAAAIAANMEAGMEELVLAVQGDLQSFRSHGIPIRIFRLNYLTADGSLAYTLDVTEDLDPSRPAGSLGSGLPENPGESLQEWISSAEAAETVEAINHLLASTGITVSFAMDGNTLIYQYYLPSGHSYSDFTEEERNAAFDAMVDANTDSVRTMFTLFSEEHGLQLDAVRFTFYSSDGTELYSRDITP